MWKGARAAALRRAAQCVSIAAQCVLIMPVMAQEWALVPEAVATIEHNTNPLFLVSDAEAATGVVGTAGVELSYETPEARARLRPRARSYHYGHDDADLNRDDQFLSAGYAAQAERYSWSIDGDYNRESTLTSELESTGLVYGNFRRTTQLVVPTVAVDVTENVLVRVSGSYMSSNYDAPLESGLIDYINQSVDATVETVKSETVSWSFGAYQSELRVDDIGRTTVTQGIQGKGMWFIHDNLNLDFQLGTRRSMHEFKGGSDVFRLEDRGWLMAANARREWERSTMTVGLSRSVDPSTNGSLQQRDRLKLNADRALTETLSLLGSAELSRFHYLGDNDNNFDRYYQRLDGRCRWQWRRAWALEAGVSVDWQGAQNSDNEARRAVISVGVSWRDEDGWL